MAATAAAALDQAEGIHNARHTPSALERACSDGAKAAQA
jgi:hypothetical protein